jgi:hypothetical protein
MIATTAGQSRETEVQSGDTQGLSKAEQTNSESVEELAADGQAFEASAVSGVEDAADPDVHEVKTREVPGDDIPREYDAMKRRFQITHSCPRSGFPE